MAAVVVLYHPDGDLLARLCAVLAQVGRLFVIGNDQLGSARLTGLPSQRIEYFENAVNSGLGVALNQGLRRAKEFGAEWCLLLDQDTLVGDDLIAGLSRVHDAYPSPSTIAILAPNYRSHEGNRVAYPESVAYQEMRTVVTSGSLLRMAAVTACGGMKEEFFIEGIDLEFALRVRQTGWKVVASGKPLMTHAAGACVEKRLLWRTVQISHHSASRYYLQSRNLTWTIVRYARFEVRWALQSVAAICKRIILISVFEEHVMSKYWALLKGFCHGVGNKLHHPPAR